MGVPFPKIAEGLRLFAFIEKPHDEIGRQSQALRTPFPKTEERLRLFAFFDTPMVKLADCLRLCALHSRKLRKVSGFLHRHDENGRQFQAVCAFGALQSRKLRNV